jgi:hypothetical protein
MRDLKPIYIIDIIRQMTIIKIRHPRLFKELAKKIGEYPDQYRNEGVDIAFYFGIYNF